MKLSKRSTWLQGIIIISAYCGYRGIDFYGLYAVDVIGMDEVKAAWLVSNGTYLRLVAAITAGLLADRFSTKKVILITFILLIFSYLVMYSLSAKTDLMPFLIANLVFSFLVVYALRGIYFALSEETQVKNHLTGTTIGVVSFIGFTPDIFFNSLMGRVLDASPGIEGYQNFFLLMIVFTTVGFAAAYLLLKNIGIQSQ